MRFCTHWLSSVPTTIHHVDIVEVKYRFIIIFIYQQQQQLHH